MDLEYHAGSVVSDGCVWMGSKVVEQEEGLSFLWRSRNQSKWFMVEMETTSRSIRK